jgi:hypothetical protein
VRVMQLTLASLAFCLTTPGLAVAQGGVTTGAATGAIGGALIGGPIGAIIGGAVGAGVGAAAEANATTWPGTVVAQPPTTGTVIQRTCVRDRAGRETCHQVAR